MGLLDKKKGAKGVVRKESDKVSPTLSSEEKARYTNIFTIMKDVINPKAEAERIGGTTAATVGGTTAMAAQATAAGGDGFNVAKLLGGAALALGGIFAGLATMLEEEFDKFGKAVFDFGGQVASDIGQLPKIALKLGKFISKRLKFIPILGSLLNFASAWDHFRKEEFFEGGYELVSGIAALIPGKGTALSLGMDALKAMYEYGNPVNEETGKRDMSFATWLKQKSIEFGEAFIKKLDAGSIPLLSGLWKFGKGIGEMLTGNFAGGFEEWSKIIPAMLGQGDNEGFLMAFDAFSDIMAVGIGEAGNIARTKSKQAFAWMDGMFTKIGKTFLGFFDAIYNFVNDSIDAGLKAITDLIPEPVKKLFESGGSNNLDAATTSASGSSTQNWAAFGRMNDGMISKDGKVTAFDDEDDILAAKRGGPIDRLLDGNSAVMKSVAAINAKQLSVLVEIRDGIRALANTGPQFNNNNLTQEFYA